MRAPSTKAIRRGVTLLALTAVSAAVPALARSGAAAPTKEASPATPAVAAALVTIDLCADEGTLALPGPTTVDIWGFSQDTGTGCGPAALPGPVLDVNVGDVVTVNLQNNLAEDVSIVFPGQSLIPNAVVVEPGTSDSYTFTASDPGTYLYEAGTNTAVQVGMGLYGALVVRPPTGAYGDSSTEFDVEEILVLSEIDANLNNYPGGPNGFDFVGDPNTYTAGYHPTYFLINGKAYPDTEAIEANVGDRVLLRYLNAGLSHHTMTLLGEHQWVVAKDAYPVATPFDAVAETIASGSTLDSIATLDHASSGAELPLYNRQLNITNDGSYPGGMLTFLAVQ
jgi:FtsP/CotA-like multicopper oxidase with cupredoxin domain